MELRHLRYFVAVAEEENVSRAALKLHVSQPAVSRQVRDLEDELGISLLERSAKAVRLTDAGRAFLTGARAVLHQTEEIVKAAKAIAAGGGEINIGYAPSLTARILPPTLRVFQAALPGIRARLHDLSTEEMLAGLRDDKLDVAFVARPAPAVLRGINFEELISDPMCLAVAPKHPWARRRSVTLEEVAREPLIAYTRKDYPDYHELLAMLFEKSKTKPRIMEEHDSVASLITALEVGNAAAVVSESLGCTAGPRLKLVPFSPKARAVVVGIAWPKARPTPAGEQFVACAREAALRLGK